jgi:hypothetical protein
MLVSRFEVFFRNSNPERHVRLFSTQVRISRMSQETVAHPPVAVRCVCILDQQSSERELFACALFFNRHAKPQPQSRER